MESIKYLEEIIKYIEQDVKTAEAERDDLKIRLDRAQRAYEAVLDKLDDHKKVLELVKKDFRQYGWNPAG